MRLALLATLLLAAPAARAVDVHVDASTGDDADDGLPLLFYSVEWPFNRILVSKDATTGSVRIGF